MSEKFFIVTEDSKLHKEYFDYEENRKTVIKIINKFYLEQGIESGTECCPHSDSLLIIPTKSDKEKFATQLCKNSDNYGLVGIKINSQMGKAWVKSLHDANIRVMREPLPQFYFHCCGHGSYRLFDIDGILYCSYSNASEINIPKGFTEIKGSEFFKVVENYETGKEEQHK